MKLKRNQSIQFVYQCILHDFSENNSKFHFFKLLNISVKSKQVALHRESSGRKGETRWSWRTASLPALEAKWWSKQVHWMGGNCHRPSPPPFFYRWILTKKILSPSRFHFWRKWLKAKLLSVKRSTKVVLYCLLQKWVLHCYSGMQKFKPQFILCMHSTGDKISKIFLSKTFSPMTWLLIRFYA